MLRETRVLACLGRTAGALMLPPPLPPASTASATPAAAGPVMVLPSFRFGPRSTWPLRRYLRRLGFTVEDWGFGVNLSGLDRPHALADISAGWHLPEKHPYHQEGCMPYMADLVTARVVARAAAHGRPLSLVGWSIGGTIAREVARDRPDAVARVVTLGAPVIGGPKYTSEANWFRRRGMDVDWMETHIARRNRRPITVPITAFYGRRDGVVSWTAAVDRQSPRVRHIQIDTPHLGLGLDPDLWPRIADALRRPVDGTYP